MKITRIDITFEDDYTFEEMYELIFKPERYEDVSELIKCFRRFRLYIVGILCITPSKLSFYFTFPNREILIKFRNEFADVTKEVSE